MSAMQHDHLSAVLAMHWRLLWALPPAERVKRFAEIEADIEFQFVLEAVEREMAVLA